MRKLIVVLAALLLPLLVQAQAPDGGAPPAAAAAPADPWPRKLELAKATLLVYQPQINRWDGNQLDFRAAVAVQAAGSRQESFGVIFATARTQVDKAARTVVLENVAVYKSDFPLLPDRGAGFAAELGKRVAAATRTISLDRMEAALAAAGIKVPPIAVDNTPPRVIVSRKPAVMVPIDGTPVLKPLGDSRRLQRVINTPALLVKDTFADAFYLHLYDGWVTADALAGNWSRAAPGPMVRRQLDDAAADLSKKGVVDLLDGGPNANPRPSLDGGVPAVFTAQGAAELVVFDGQPNFVPIANTQLLWASNTHNDVIVDTAGKYYVLLAGRWFRAPALDGPWAFVAANALPADFARIPPQAAAGAVLPSVAGTPQAQSAVIANSIPQTATVQRSTGPKFTPSFDGAPQYRPIDGTALTHVVNSSTPIIRADAAYYALASGVWFTAPAATGPWTVAASVPAAIYGIPASSPLHFVTYVRIYEATPQVVYVGYTPGYLGTVVTPEGTVVYGTGYAYPSWVGDVWYPAPVTYTLAATPVYNPWVGFTFGFAVGMATAWTYPYYGGAWYHPGYWGAYPCCASASANVYGHWGNTVYSGTRSWYAGGGVAGTTAGGTYANQRTGTSGSYEAGRQVNAWTGNATRAYDRTATTPAGGSANVARAANTNAYTGQRSTGSAVSGTTAGGSTYDRAGATTTGPEGSAHVGGGSTYSARTGETNTWATASVGNNHYADVDGNVYRNTGGGWEKQGGGGWSSAPEASSWGEREAQARGSGEERFSGFSGAEANRTGSFGGGRFGGSAFGGGERFGGGGSFGGRFGGGGFRGRR